MYLRFCFMNKKFVLIFALLPLLFTACDDSSKSAKTPDPGVNHTPTSDNSQADGDSQANNNSEASQNSTPSSAASTPTPSSYSNPTPPASSSSAKTETVAEIIGKKVKAETGGKYVDQKDEDDDTYTYTFSYLNGESFVISSSVVNKYNSYSYQTSVSFRWGNLKDSTFNGEATDNKDNLLRCIITCDYGTAPSISYKSYEEETSTFTSDKAVAKAKELVSFHQKAYQIVQNYIKAINSSYTLW